MFAVRYQKILDTLRMRITSGQYADRLPPLRDLCAEFGVCKSTMSKVFDKLSFYGLIRTSPHGTFVCQREENTEKRRKFAAIISRKLGRDEDFFTSELKKQLENRITYYEKGDRRKRAHHLITRGAAIESVAPLTKVLTETEFYAFAEKAFSLPEIKGLLMQAINEHNITEQKER